MISYSKFSYFSVCLFFIFSPIPDYLYITQALRIPPPKGQNISFSYDLQSYRLRHWILWYSLICLSSECRSELLPSVHPPRIVS